MRHFFLSQNSVWGEWCDINKLGRGGNLMEDKEEQARPKKKNGAPKKPISQAPLPRRASGDLAQS